MRQVKACITSTKCDAAQNFKNNVQRVIPILKLFCGARILMMWEILKMLAG